MPNRQRHNTADVVVLRAELLFAEVANEVCAVIIRLGYDVEQERFHIIEERFVVEEHLRQQTQVLTVDLVLPSVHFKD